jgi:hypothetical protein
VISGGWDSAIKLWDSRTRTPVGTHPQPVLPYAPYFLAFFFFSFFPPLAFSLSLSLISLSAHVNAWRVSSRSQFLIDLTQDRVYTMALSNHRLIVGTAGTAAFVPRPRGKDNHME